MIQSPQQYLRDIHGLDPVGWWPPAPGWWLIAAATVLTSAALVWLYRNRFALMGWRRDARRQLTGLERRLDSQSTRQSAAELSELLRRIAMARCGRRSCAGLTGREWLEWLTSHDPAGFDWVRQGRALVVSSYAPEEQGPTLDVIRRLLRATRVWVLDGRARGCPEPVQMPASGSGGDI